MSLWLPTPKMRHGLSFGLLAVAGLVAFSQGVLSYAALIWVGVLFITGHYYHLAHSHARKTSRTLFLGLVLAFGFGLLPGFDSVVLQGAQTVKIGSAEYTLRIRPDKVLAGFALLAFVLPLSRTINAWRSIMSVAPASTIMTALLVLGAGWFSGYIAFLPQLPTVAFLIVWALANLLFVTGIEEGFFRGIIQRSLQPHIGTIGAISIGAILFGLAHAGGGVLYLALATLAGLGYGTAYHLAKHRIEAAMLTHFGVNLLHIVFFSYPYAK